MDRLLRCALSYVSLALPHREAAPKAGNIQNINRWTQLITNNIATVPDPAIIDPHYHNER